MPACSWDGFGPVINNAIGSDRPSSRVVQPEPSLGEGQQRMLSHIQGLAYGIFEKKVRRPYHGNCVVRSWRRGPFGKSKGFLCGLKLVGTTRAPYLVIAWKLPQPDDPRPYPQLVCTATRPIGNEYFDCLPIERYILDHRLTPDQLSELRDELRIAAAA